MINFSFLLPAYKARYFTEALKSIKNQTLADFKCIVSDDCSPEDLKTIFDKAVGCDTRFTYRRNEANMGGTSLVAHWNMLVDMCDTEYFIMASDDDVYEPNFLEEIDRLVKKYPDIDMFRGKVRYINGENELLRQDSLTEVCLDRLHFLENYYSEHILACEACFCYRTKAVDGYQDYPLAWYTDDAQHIQMSKNGCAITPDITFNYRVSDIAISSITTDHIMARKKLESAMMFYDWFYDYSKSLESSDELWLSGHVKNKIKGRVIEQLMFYSRKLDKKGICWLLKSLDLRLGVSRKALLLNWLQSR